MRDDGRERDNEVMVIDKVWARYSDDEEQTELAHYFVIQSMFRASIAKREYALVAVQYYIRKVVSLPDQGGR